MRLFREGIIKREKKKSRIEFWGILKLGKEIMGLWLGNLEESLDRMVMRRLSEVGVFKKGGSER